MAKNNFCKLSRLLVSDATSSTDGWSPVFQIFSENEFLCCVKLGEPTPGADQCCSGHAVYQGGDQSKEMECRLPFGANLNVYFNRFVSSDGLLEDATLRGDKTPIGFMSSHFNPKTGEIIPSEDTDEILKKLGEKYCTDDLGNDPRRHQTGTVRRGAAVGYFGADPGLFYSPSEFPSGSSFVVNDSADTNYEFRRLSIVDNPADEETSQNDAAVVFPRGYIPYLAGLRWNHHFYCYAEGDGN